jgi:hypothetical protein
MHREHAKGTPTRAARKAAVATGGTTARPTDGEWMTMATKKNQKTPGPHAAESQ